MIVQQTTALFIDAYRELNSQKLFWITLLLSGLVAASFALVGIDEKGLTLVIWKIDFLTSNEMSPEVLYKSMFANMAIPWWLGFFATFLAIISTAGIFPTLIAGGSIDLILSKPIGRLRLFVTKYLTGLMFVALQVVAFTAACFLVIGLRGGVWEPGLFIAVPLVVLFFSYLYSVCVLIGVLTRSTIAAILLTILIWFLFWALHMPSSFVTSMRVGEEVKLERVEREIAKYPPAELPPEVQAQLIEAQQGTRKIQVVDQVFTAVRSLLPKTGETLALLDRVLVDLADLPDTPQEAQNPSTPMPLMFDPEVQRRIAEALRERSAWWIVGTSLGFELVIVGIAGWVFCRRDY